jgi:nucleoside-diphosphate-sugar epimerase
VKRVLIAGCGDLGTRVGVRFQSLGFDVVGLKRSASKLPFPLIRADLAQPFQVDASFTHVVIALTPDARDEAAYRATYVDAVANLHFEDRPRVLFVSSTSVWGDHGGEWVDETTPARPDGFNGRVLLEAESQIDGIVLRLAGIYGPGRTGLIDRVRSGKPVTNEWTNRIHVDDAAAAIVHLMTLESPERLYVGVDREPARMGDVADFLAGRLGVPHCPRTDGPQNKRLSSEKLVDAGFTHQFPDFRSGYAALV